MQLESDHGWVMDGLSWRGLIMTTICRPKNYVRGHGASLKLPPFTFLILSQHASKERFYILLQDFAFFKTKVMSSQELQELESMKIVEKGGRISPLFNHRTSGRK